MHQLKEFCRTKDVLIIVDDEKFWIGLQNAIKDPMINVECSRNLEEARDVFNCSKSYALILLDTEQAGEKSRAIRRSIGKEKPFTKVLTLFKNKALDDIPSNNKGGKSNVIFLDLGVDQVAKEVIRSFADMRTDNSSVIFEYPKIIGRGESHLKILEKIDQIKDVDACVLITGESGTGKELVAGALHETSVRKQARYEAINCGAIPENLLESELFGHKRGAFTDAKTEKKGLFEYCTNGTLLLDEIGEMPLNLQVKLLRVLQEKEIRPLGGTQSIKVGTRIIAATNKDLKREVELGNFREDLYYRLSVLKIHIPPLRERSEDIPVLVNNFINNFIKTHDKYIQPLTEDQMSKLQFHHWKGNIRELKNSLERGVILARDSYIDLQDIFEDDNDQNLHIDDSSDFIPRNYIEAKKDFENKYLHCLLRDARGNVSEAARLAGKTRVEIYRFINRNRIDPGEFRSEL